MRSMLPFSVNGLTGFFLIGGLQLEIGKGPFPSLVDTVDCKIVMSQHSKLRLSNGSNMKCQYNAPFSNMHYA